MKLSELIHAVYKDKRARDIGFRKDEVEVLVKVMLDHIVIGLLTYGKIKMQGLFTLKVKEAKGRKIRNPQTGEIMYSKDYMKVGIEPSKRLKDGLKDFKS